MFTERSIKLFQFITIFLAFSSYQFTSGKFILTPTGNAKVPTPNEKTNSHQAGPLVTAPMVDGTQICTEVFGQRHTSNGNSSIKAEPEASIPCQTKDAVFMCQPASCHSHDKKPHASASGCEGASGPRQCLSYVTKLEAHSKSSEHSPTKPVHPSPAPQNASHSAPAPTNASHSAPAPHSSPASQNATHTIKTRAEPVKKNETPASKAPLECVTSSDPPKSVGCQKLESAMECTKCQRIV
ncbi:secreted protein [Melampsora americana]|nr:secreted protein [Melampsora americana]